MSPRRPAPARPVHRRHSGPNPHENAAAAPGVVPRQLEFHQNTNIINSLQKSGVQVGFEIACPLRRTSFEGLRLSHSLLRDELGYRVALGPKQMKTGQAFEAPLAAWLTPH